MQVRYTLHPPPLGTKTCALPSIATAIRITADTSTTCNSLYFFACFSGQIHAQCLYVQYLLLTGLPSGRAL